jgi:hypothetical protein
MCSSAHGANAVQSNRWSAAAEMSLLATGQETLVDGRQTHQIGFCLLSRVHSCLTSLTFFFFLSLCFVSSST